MQVYSGFPTFNLKNKLNLLAISQSQSYNKVQGYKCCDPIVKREALLLS